MKKAEIIAKYGEEEYERRKKVSMEWHRKNAAAESKAGLIARHGEEWYENKKKNSHKNDRHKPDLIAKYGQEWYDHKLQLGRDFRKRTSYNCNISLTEEQRRIRNEKALECTKKYISNPVNRLHMLFYFRKRYGASAVSPDEAMSLLIREAEECGCPELLDMNYMLERFHNNCKHSLVYGNLEILRYFYKLMQIKAAKNEGFTESDIEMIRYFRSWKVDTHIYGRLHLNNKWVIDVANVDMAYIEDMMRNVKGDDLLLTEEKYNELKGLTNDT